LTIQLINTGAFSNDTTGTPAQTAFQIINANFSQLFGLTPYTIGPPTTPPGGVALTLNAAVGSAALVINQAGSVAAQSIVGQAGAPVSLKLTDGQTGTTVWSVNVGVNVAGEFEIINNTAGATPLKISAVNGGITAGTATGGSQGAGTVNAQGLFVNGTPVTTAAGNTGYILCLPQASPSIVSSIRITSPAITRSSTGTYVVTHNLGTAIYGVTATVLQNSGAVGVVTVFGPTSTQISFLTLVGGSLSDAIGDVYLNFIY
jgi:hypothetical protein